LHDSLLIHLGFEHCNFLNTDISQGSVVRQLRCSGIVVQDFVVNLLLNLSAIQFWTSVKIWQSFYGQYYSGLFFIDSQCNLQCGWLCRMV